MTTPLISIITPSFNHGKFLERTLQSVLQQNVPGLEYFVMDGGSQDESKTILASYSDVIHWVSEPDNGQAHAVNKGLQQAKGAIIGWLNSDDIYYPQAIHAVADFFVRHPEVDVVYGKAYHIDENDQLIEFYPTQEWNLSQLKQSCYLCQPAVFFRRSVIERFGLLNEKLHFCMDYEFWLRLATLGARFKHLPIVLAGSRLHGETKTLSAPLKSHLESLTMLQTKFGNVSATWLINYAIIYLKSTSTLHFPQPKFILAVWFTAVRLSFTYNPLVKALLSCLTIPLTLMSLCYKKLRIKQADAQ